MVFNKIVDQIICIIDCINTSSLLLKLLPVLPPSRDHDRWHLTSILEQLAEDVQSKD